MSLLLDALRRAEQEKQVRQGAQPPPAKPALELAPIATPESAAAARAQPSSSGAAAAMKPATPSAGSRKFLWIGAGVVALVAVAIGGYVWYSISALAPAPIARAPAPRLISPAPPPPAAEAPAPEKAEATTATTPGPPQRAPEPERRSSARAAEGRVTPENTDTAESAATPAMLQPARPADRARLAPQIASGYAALRAGDLATAQRDYAAAVDAEPSNIDALLGLATVEARSARPEAAVVLYRRALEVDPRNATALAALATLAEPIRAESLEQRLVSELAQNPRSAALNFMLGNLYAGQALWAQAQASYFEAHRLDPGNPDILHNLAVSLDRMGQPKVAATYYRKALEAARVQATQFDAAAVTRRLGEIERVK
jgi:tetratricopeptide (TPR) repeat protein